MKKSISCYETIENASKLKGKININPTIKLNSYAIISEAIESGIDWGWMHSRKHDDNPNEDTIKEHIYRDIMNELSEIIIWDDNYAEKG